MRVSSRFEEDLERPMKHLVMLAAIVLVLPGLSRSVDTPERITPNDNTHTAGSLANGVLTIHLEARSGDWHPDADDGPAVRVSAFGVEGGPLQVPGPLVRVRAGIQIHAVVRNRLDQPLVLYGLYARPANTDAAAEPMTIPPGETREATFAASTPGTYYYWAAPDASTGINQRVEGGLSGAFVVDPADGTIALDRILVITHWGDAGLDPLDRRFLFVINGRSWPHTERLTYAVGDIVRMRIINASNAVHPMHLHGFYFNVDSRGTERADTPLTKSPHLVVTERTVPGSTFALTWKPTRPGNWLFHCHDTAHVTYVGALGGDRSPAPTMGMMDMMAGPVMGITVTGKTIEPAPAQSPRRQLRLVARAEPDGTAEEPSYGYTLESGRESTPAKPPYLPAPTIVLKRGEPVAITVVNQLPVPTSVHWHGIELESYYDGVAGFAGDGARLAPPIEPGGSFEARFTPPRSGTFIYHTHLDDLKQQQAGLTGALLVVDDPSTYDAEHDLVMLVTTPRKNPRANVVLLNGTATPAATTLHAGEHYRLRFINVHVARPSMRMRLLRGQQLVKWRAIAKDGMDLPADQVSELASEVQMGNGETYDFDFVPAERGDLRLDINTAAGILLTSMPIRVVDSTPPARGR
jgi:FtsP/CotA-like multicopper oxidase with cupredoxin domain